ncbi:MAG: hypothetical protein V3V96_13005 [Acidiferrobacterales bacterium]
MHYAGDAVLADFGTVVDALTCAAAIQRDLAERNSGTPKQRKVQFRIGVSGRMGCRQLTSFCYWLILSHQAIKAVAPSSHETKHLKI